MTISKALKKLYKTITGKDATGKTIEAVVSELNDNYPSEGGGGSGLPPVTAANAYEVPRVTAEGEWVTERVDFGVVFAYNNGSVSTEVDVTEISEAQDDHKNVFGILEKDGNSYNLPLCEIGAAEQHLVVKFAAVIENANVVITGTDGEGATDTWTYTETAQDNEFFIETTIAIPSYEVANADVRWSDLVAAIVADKIIRIVVKNDDYGIVINGTFAQKYSANGAMFIGSGFVGTGSTPYLTYGIVSPTGVDGSQIKFSISFREYLPEVTGDDNGKVLGVNSGAYALVDAMPYIMHATISGSTVTLIDGDVAEAIAAKNDGRVVQLEYTDSNMGATLTLEMSGRSYTDDDNCAASFCGNTCDTTAITTEVIMLFKSSGSTTGVDYKYDHSVGQ